MLQLWSPQARLTGAQLLRGQRACEAVMRSIQSRCSHKGRLGPPRGRAARLLAGPNDGLILAAVFQDAPPFRRSKRSYRWASCSVFLEFLHIETVSELNTKQA